MTTSQHQINPFESHFARTFDSLEETVRKCREELANMEQETFQRCQEREDQVQEKEEKLKSLQQKLQESESKSKAKIMLNVGGVKFLTSKTTLERLSDNYFSALMRSNWQPDEDGAFFIDRDPKHFGLILNFLRDGEMCFILKPSAEMKEIEAELNYYQIPHQPEAYVPRAALVRRVVGRPEDRERTQGRNEHTFIRDREDRARREVRERPLVFDAGRVVRAGGRRHVDPFHALDANPFDALGEEE